MRADFAPDDLLLQRLPLPLAQLYRRAPNAKTPLERHLTAFYLWEASLKLLASVAVAEYAARDQHDPQMAERLTSLARPALGHWWEYVCLLVPALADGGDPGFAAVRDLLLGKTRDDLPRCAGLDALLRQGPEGKGTARATVRLTELFNRLVQYRNTTFAHGAAGRLPAEFHERMAGALLAATGELLGRLDVLAGRRLVFVSEVRQAGGVWLAQRYELIGESGRRIASLELPREATAQVPDGERVYLVAPIAPPGGGVEGEGEGPLRPLHPLLLYDAEAEECLFLNARRGQRQTEYLCYTTGRTLRRPDLGTEGCRLLGRLLGMAVTEDQKDGWAGQAEAADPAGEAEPAAPARRVVGECQLLSELGRGGMGVVYRAWQPSLGRQVALKCLLQTGDARAEARFRREIKALGRVEHPNLVKVFTSGSDGDQWFYAMELVEGVPLSAVCDQLQTKVKSVTELDLPAWQETLSAAFQAARQAEKPFDEDTASGERQPPVVSGPEGVKGQRADAPRSPGGLAGRSYIRQVVELVRQVAEAAHALHEKGIVHRDIKPGNILLSADGSQAVLMDLGLAQLADDVEGRVTRTRQFVGTLRYASPEQVLAVGGLDRRSDVYSLGAALWELLALRPLYGATDETPSPEVMRRIQFEEPGRLRQGHPALARDLEAVVHRSLEKDPRRRYATAKELAEDLGRYLAGKPVRARPVGSVERGWRWCRRNPAVAALLAGVVAVLLLGTGVSAFFAVRAENKARVVSQLLYISNMRLAQQAWESNQTLRVLQLLDGQVPERTNGTDLRRFEWYYWWHCAHTELLTVKGHMPDVHSVCFSPDGTRLATASRTGTAKVWDAKTGQEALSLKGDARYVFSVCFSSDGTRLATASAVDAVKVWDARTGREVLSLGDSGTYVCFSPDGTRLAGFSRDRTVKVWDARTGQEVLSLGDRGTSVCFSPDGTRLATAGAFGVKVWDARTGQETLSLKGRATEQGERAGPETGVCFSPDSSRLATVPGDKTAVVWDVGTGRKLLTLKGHTQEVLGVCFSPDGTRLATAAGDYGGRGELRVWDARTGQDCLALKDCLRTLRCVCFSPDGSRLAGGGGEFEEPGEVKVWDARTGQEMVNHKGHAGAVWDVCFSPDGTRLASASEDGTAKVWDAKTAQEPLSLQGPRTVCGVCFSPDGSRLVGGSPDNTVKIWDARTGQESLTLKGHTAPIFGACFSPDGNWLASASWDGTVKVWDAKTAQEALTVRGHTDGAKGHTGSVLGLCFSPDSRRLASASGYNTVKVWDARTGQEVLTLRGYRIWFSPDGTRLATASDNGSGSYALTVWDARTGREVLRLDDKDDSGPTPKSYSAPVTSACFSPDSSRLAAASTFPRVIVWDAKTGQQILTLRGHTAGACSVCFSPDGSRLASASMDGTVKLWESGAGQETLTLRAGPGPVTLCFSPDGTRLAGTRGDGIVQIWEAPKGHDIAMPSRSH
jgi:WD40 repeat protein/serine/threonine protein kinase